MENKNPIRFIDLFAGIGGFRYAIQNASNKLEVPVKCVFSSEIDKECQRAYQENFGEVPKGDITQIVAESIPNHDFLLAGFPCQPFSIIGKRKGFEDTRGTLFFDIARILAAKKPTTFVLENVKLLVAHNKGKTIKRIIETLEELGYHTTYKVLNALDFGLPQKRERVFIVGFRKPSIFNWPEEKVQMKSLNEILEKEVPKQYYVSGHIRKKRLSQYQKLPTKELTIWHENKAGHISVYPFSCALRAGASYNYLLVNGKRRLTSREMLRLQGFPESFKIVCSYTQTRKQAGNSLPVPVAQAIIERVFQACGWTQMTYCSGTDLVVNGQLRLFEDQTKYYEIAKA
ncbi:DNA (cytosine-5-)-methyltransferase [Candidatus Thiomargarita nelsonii]|uniref:Cytosine-specific methyltransferase n=1 Tax=Candidatus Thiomargarita nelsonii TaxID=1003181 RepID=A0A176S4Z9_9GAMM|nr:DNA (cytosine-5-)-methyltransferase [Candidatus Thiomargarita nelsonii]